MVLVTGACGHIGNTLVRKLLDLGEKVRALVFPGEDTSSMDGLAVEQVHGDVCDRKSLDEAFTGADTVFHLAGMVSIIPGKKDLLYRVNVLGTRNIVDACLSHKVSRLIYTSSVHALPDLPKGMFISESSGFSTGTAFGEYGKSKAAATLEVFDGIKRGLDAVICCPSGVMGPNDYKPSKMGQCLMDFVSGKMRMSLDGGYDFVDVRDVATGEIAAWKKGRTGETYILKGEKITVTQILSIAAYEEGVKPPKFSVPYFLARIGAFFFTLFSRGKREPLLTSESLSILRSNYNFKNEKTVSELGYITRRLDETIADTLRWFRARGMIKGVMTKINVPASE
jgi:dihydroflavonol-4-reductase